MDKKYTTCFGCRKKGHYKSECLANEDGEEEEEMDIANLMLNTQGIVLMTTSPTINLPSMTWIANLGVSTHIMNEECGLYKKRCIN